jgi:DNA-binding NarL/FixJ family response regulator
LYQIALRSAPLGRRANFEFPMQLSLMPALPSTTAEAADLTSQPAIWIVDDEESEIAGAVHFLSRVGIRSPLLRIGGTDEAIAHLSACLVGAEPMLVFIDLKTPGANGFRVLDWMRHHKAFHRTLTIVLSSSRDPRDIVRALALGARSFLSRHPQVEEIRTVFQFAASIRAVEELNQLIERMTTVSWDIDYADRHRRLTA